VASINKLKRIYQRWQKGLRDLQKAKNAGIDIDNALIEYPTPPLNITRLKYEVKDWIRTMKPVVGEEIYALPNEKRRNDLENAKQKELRRLKAALAETESKNWKPLMKLAWFYLGRLSRVRLTDISLEKRIENQIRRRFNKKKYSHEGTAHLPPVATGELLQPQLHQHIRMIIEKNPDIFPQDLPWVIEVKFDPELRETKEGKSVVPAGNGRFMQKHNETLAPTKKGARSDVKS